MIIFKLLSMLVHLFNLVSIIFAEDVTDDVMKNLQWSINKTHDVADSVFIPDPMCRHNGIYKI